jgi:uncharacterized protein YcfJ
MNHRNTIARAAVGLATAMAAGVVVGFAAVGIERYAASTEDVTDRAAARNCDEARGAASAEPADDKLVAGTVIGALVGGAVGNDVGDSDLTTAAGAAAGAYAGNRAEKKFQEERTRAPAGSRCDP